jgi:hypothetical protein
MSSRWKTITLTLASSAIIAANGMHMLHAGAQTEAPPAEASDGLLCAKDENRVATVGYAGLADPAPTVAAAIDVYLKPMPAITDSSDFTRVTASGAPWPEDATAVDQSEQLLVEKVLSEDGRAMAVVTQTPEGLWQVEGFVACQSYVEDVLGEK